MLTSNVSQEIILPAASVSTALTGAHPRCYYRCRLCEGKRQPPVRVGGTALTTAPLIDVTPQAAEKLEAVIKDHGDDGALLRVMVTPGQNGGFQYALGVEKEAGEDDLVIETETIQVLVDRESAPLIDGSQIDYVEGLMRSGFVISNPNFAGGGGGGGCGCGGGGGCGCGGGGGHDGGHGGGGGCGCGGDGGGHGGGHGGGGGCACGGH